MHRNEWALNAHSGVARRAFPGAPAVLRHTRIDLSSQAKTHAATVNAGGGKAGLADRKGGAAGHSRFLCKHCKTPVTSLTAARIHHDAKHPTIAYADADYQDVHAEHGFSTTVGVAVRGVRRQVAPTGLWLAWCPRTAAARTQLHHVSLVATRLKLPALTLDFPQHTSRRRPTRKS